MLCTKLNRGSPLNQVRTTAFLLDKQYPAVDSCLRRFVVRLKAFVPILTLGLLCAGMTLSAHVDSLRVRDADTVTVEVSPFDVALQRTLPVFTLSSDRLKAQAPTQITDVMSLVPGTFVRDYGGLGGLKTVSIRGGSGSQSLLLIEGVRLTSAQNGLADLGGVPVTMIGSVHTTRGGAAALFGANALTGVLDIGLRTPTATSARASACVGSFEESRTSFDVDVVQSGMSVAASLDVLSTRGSFPFTMRESSGDVVNRENGDARLVSAMISFRPLPSTSAYVLARSSSRGVPGAVVRGSVAQARARLQDEDLVAGFRSTIVTSDNSFLTVRSGLRFADMQYRDPDANLTGIGGIDERYTTRDVLVSADYSVMMSSLLFSVRGEGGYADLRGGALQPDVGDMVRRACAAMSITASMPVTDRLNVQVALRYDIISDAGNALSPLISARYAVNDDVSIRSSWSYNFRPASFNELYYLNYGTSGLRPERSHTVNLGVALRPMPWIVVESDAFVVTTTDLIVAVPVSPVITSASNVGRAQTLGLESSVRASLLDERCTATWSWTITDARDKTGRSTIDGTLIPYVPNEMIGMSIDWIDDRILASVRMTYVGGRFSQPGGEATSLLQPFTVVSASIGTRGTMGSTFADVRLSADNLGDVSYAVVRGYPMPGRTIRLSVALGVEP